MKKKKIAIFQAPNLLIFRCSLILTVFLLIGCSENTKQNALAVFFAEVKNNKPKEIEAPPNFQEVEFEQYKITNERNIFLPSSNILKSNSDKTQQVEGLAAYHIDDLQMVGVLRTATQLWAFVAAPDGKIYRVAPGSYIGKNCGEVKKIDLSHLELLETIHQQHGGWEKTTKNLMLSNE